MDPGKRIESVVTWGLHVNPLCKKYFFVRYGQITRGSIFLQKLYLILFLFYTECDRNLNYNRMYLSSEIKLFKTVGALLYYESETY